MKVVGVRFHVHSVRRDEPLSVHGVAAVRCYLLRWAIELSTGTGQTIRRFVRYCRLERFDEPISSMSGHTIELRTEPSDELLEKLSDHT